MTVTTHKKGVCPNSDIRLKVWKGGFSIKCMTAKIVHTLVSMPYDEQHFKEAEINFCRGCSEINKSHDSN